MTFENLRLAEPILRALASEGYLHPTPIQAQAIPHVIEGRDVLGCAQTGTGKTAAFALPMIHRLSDGARPGANRPIRALVLSPTRELAAQIAESFRVYGKGSHLRHTEVYGGVNQNPQTRALRQGVDVLIATPGRLMDLIEQGFINLSSVQTFVLDEADRMLDMGFINDIRKVAALLPKKRQTLLFSATMPGPIRSLANSLLHQPVEVKIEPVAATVDLITQSVYHIEKGNKPALLRYLLENQSVSRALVFTRTKHGADRLTSSLSRAGVRAEAIHGNKTQAARQRALTNFRGEKTQVLVATDVAARGIDVDDISHVIQFDLPNEPETYVHRIGRTGRAGATGLAISFCDSSERGYLRAIEQLTSQRIPVEKHEGDFPAMPAGEPKPAASRAPRPRAAQSHNQPAGGRPRSRSGSGAAVGAGAGSRRSPRSGAGRRGNSRAPKRG